MSALEAFEAIGEIEHRGDSVREAMAAEFAIVRSALLAAQQHAKDLQTIAEWKRVDVNRDAVLHVWDFYFHMLLSGPRGWSMPFDDFDPMKAIHDAAEWIRKELDK